MKYLKKFATHSDYEAYITGSSVAYPNVSVCEEEYEVHMTDVGEIIDPDKHEDYNQMPLTFEITSPGNFCFSCRDNNYTKTIQYSKNGGEWTNLTSTWNQEITTAITVNGLSGTYSFGGWDTDYNQYCWEKSGNKLYSTNLLLNTSDYMFDGQYEYQVATVQNQVIAEPISVVAGDAIQFRGNNTTYANSGDIYNSFSGTTCGFKVKGNIMSLINSTDFSAATTLQSTFTFNYLFNSCTGLTDASNLVLPATTLTNSCYRNLFRGCTGLLTAPSILPATTLTQYCYRYMFTRCSSLTVAPELPATTLVNGCYQDMFWNCSSLNHIKCLATNISAQYCTDSWVEGVASSGTFVKAAGMSSWTTGTSGIPTNWTVEDAS